jgi:hypothetical protein
MKFIFLFFYQIVLKQILIFIIFFKLANTLAKNVSIIKINVFHAKLLFIFYQKKINVFVRKVFKTKIINVKKF